MRRSRRRMDRGRQERDDRTVAQGDRQPRADREPKGIVRCSVRLIPPGHRRPCRAVVGPPDRGRPHSDCAQQWLYDDCPVRIGRQDPRLERRAGVDRRTATGRSRMRRRYGYGIAFHFVIEPLYTAQVSSQADVAARMLEHLVKRKQHYESAVIPALRGMGAAGPEDRMLAGAWSATASQLLSTRNDLLQLMEDARAQGSENLQQRAGRVAGPELDLSLTPPSSANPVEIKATLYVMWDGLRGAARDAGDQLNRLNAWLSQCADPVARAFVEQLSALAIEVRPQDAPPGPYAPGPVETGGPTGHTALMRGYTVEVVASFKSEVDLMQVIFGRLPSKPSGVPNFGQLAEDVNVEVGTTSDTQPPNLTVTYPARGQNAEEACRFAVALFERDCSRHSLPDPKTLTTNTQEAPSLG